jgi:hypothetical protein
MVRDGGTPQNPSQSLFHLKSVALRLKLQLLPAPWISMLLHSMYLRAGPQRLPLKFNVLLLLPPQVTGAVVVIV